VRGVGRAGGAITFVNALASGGTGSAGGVSLPAEASVELRPTARGEPGTCTLDSRCDTPLARATLLAALRAYVPARDWHVRLAVRSSVPVARGLKSSSAVGGAIARAVAAAARRSVPDLEVARLAAETARDIGLSLTGAFDDAVAALTGEIAVTENAVHRVLAREPWPHGWAVVLRVPRETHPPSTDLAAAFARPDADGKAAADAARRGRYADAMRRNTRSVERALGYDFEALRARLAAAGAIASGVSGMGPAVAALVPVGRGRAVARACAEDGVLVLETEPARLAAAGGAA
jgi:shikimate kinase